MAMPSQSPPFSLISPSSFQTPTSMRLSEQVEALIGKICREQSIDRPDDVALSKLYQLGEEASMRILRKIERSKVRKTFSAFLMYLAQNESPGPGPCSIPRSPVGRERSSFSSPYLREDSVPSSVAYGMFEPSSTPTSQLITTSGNMLLSPPIAPTTPQPVCSPTLLNHENYGTVHRRLEFSGLANNENHNKPQQPPTVDPTCQAEASPEMLALGELEFWKIFLILSYLGRAKLEQKVTVDYIKSLQHMPMQQFELEIFKKLGGNHIKSIDRRKVMFIVLDYHDSLEWNFQWDTSKTYVYRCHVDLNGDATFKGPFLEPDQTHLQRVLGDDNILQVTFEETKEEQNASCRFDNHSDVYQRIVQEGIMLGLRRYDFLVYKDGGKDGSKKNPTSSSVKCYFVRTYSGWFMDQRSGFLHRTTANEIRLAFMHIHTVTSPAKYMLRFALILSKTVKHQIDLSLVKVELIDDIPCMDGSTSTKGIHTDGTGFISEDLALQCPFDVFKGKIQTGVKGSYAVDGSSSSKRRRYNYYNEGPPLLSQVRLFFEGLAAKGTLLVNKKLPSNTIQIRPSMVKVKSDASIQIQPFNSLEIVTTSYRPKKVHLSRFLISLLHYGGVPSEFFLGLLSGALVEIEDRISDRNAAINVVKNNSCLDDDDLVSRMLYSKIPLDEPFLKYRLSIMIGEENKGLQEGKIPISNTYFLMGTADPTGKLGPNQVCVILDEGHLSGDVLVYKYPGLHTGDIHKLQATYLPELEEIVGNSKYGIFFPTVGPRSLADEMANSDFDGDMYWISQNPELLKKFTPGSPWPVPEEDLCKNDPEQPVLSNMKKDELESWLFREFLKIRFKPSYAIGTAADCWLAYMDRVLTRNLLGEEESKTIQTKMEQLVNIYYDALDAEKTGKQVQVPNYLLVDLYPDFMDKKPKEKTYHSTSILGEIYDKVESFKSEKLQLTEIKPLPFFMEGVLEPCMDKWHCYYNQYLIEMHHASSIELKDVRNKTCQEVIDKYKEILYGGVKEFNSSRRPRSEIYEEARAIYKLAYEKACQKGTVSYCSFPWRVAGEALCQMYIEKMGKPYMVDGDVLREARQ
ncbi:hypothetical protein LUZ63_018902 [Rhynchospora breviuscula]|uniref:RNA-dependent RNA polymerase n=1 Tax=Rhynchospora breviuscula TaxID=2022672 RepID=A0A9Q0C565_9POAL|nr:hypothetical protein LUZ63_018902 [Rhynchospora breviuscula]